LIDRPAARLISACRTKGVNTHHHNFKVAYLSKGERVTCIEDHDLQPAPLPICECRVHNVFGEQIRGALGDEIIIIVTITVGVTEA
jgi:hypothetical protein